MRKILIAMLASLAAACATPTLGPPVVDESGGSRMLGPLRTSFSAADYAWAAARGRNSVTGSAVLRTRGGEPRTCAGLTAKLYPAGAYTDEVMGQMYGGADRGLYDGRATWTPPGPVPAWAAAARQSACDGQGYFLFDGVPDGAWYVVAEVTWDVPSGGAGVPFNGQGGWLMQKITLAGGETKRVVLVIG